MGFTETILFYLLFGVGIAAAIALANDEKGRSWRIFQIVTACFFWPLYLPLLLEKPARTAGVQRLQSQATAKADDEFASAFKQVEAELEAALDSLDGWAENVLAPEQDRFAELRAAWRLQAQRIRELDRLLDLQATTGMRPIVESAGQVGSVPEGCGNNRYRQSEQARRDNLERLYQVRQRLYDDLMGTLAWVRELVSMIHLAKFTGAPASRAEELVAQIATAVEGLSEVTQWPQEAVPPVWHGSH